MSVPNCSRENCQLRMEIFVTLNTLVSNLLLWTLQSIRSFLQKAPSWLAPSTPNPKLGCIRQLVINEQQFLSSEFSRYGSPSLLTWLDPPTKIGFNSHLSSLLLYYCTLFQLPAYMSILSLPLCTILEYTYIHIYTQLACQRIIRPCVYHFVCQSRLFSGKLLVQYTGIHWTRVM